MSATSSLTRSWLGRLVALLRRRGSPAPRTGGRLRVEALEDRALPAATPMGIALGLSSFLQGGWSAPENGDRFEGGFDEDLPQEPPDDPGPIEVPPEELPVDPPEEPAPGLTGPGILVPEIKSAVEFNAPRDRMPPEVVLAGPGFPTHVHLSLLGEGGPRRESLRGFSAGPWLLTHDDAAGPTAPGASDLRSASPSDWLGVGAVEAPSLGMEQESALRFGFPAPDERPPGWTLGLGGEEAIAPLDELFAQGRGPGEENVPEDGEAERTVLEEPTASAPGSSALPPADTLPPDGLEQPLRRADAAEPSTAGLLAGLSPDPRDADAEVPVCLFDRTVAQPEDETESRGIPTLALPLACLTVLAQSLLPEARPLAPARERPRRPLL